MSVNLTRRSLVTSAAALPTLAVPAAGVSSATPEPMAACVPKVEHITLAVGDISRAACVTRAEYIVESLSTRYIREGWHGSFDRERAARFLENMRTFDFSNGDDPRFREILEWVADHGQCLDWIFVGNPGPMIARLAAD